MGSGSGECEAVWRIAVLLRRFEEVAVWKVLKSTAAKQCVIYLVPGSVGPGEVHVPVQEEVKDQSMKGVCPAGLTMSPSSLISYKLPPKTLFSSLPQKRPLLH